MNQSALPQTISAGSQSLIAEALIQAETGMERGRERGWKEDGKR
jgi:hypothetical protein